MYAIQLPGGGTKNADELVILHVVTIVTAHTITPYEIILSHSSYSLIFPHFPPLSLSIPPHFLTFPHIPSHFFTFPHIPSYSLTFPHFPSQFLPIPSHSLTFPHIFSHSLIFPHIPSLSPTFPPNSSPFPHIPSHSLTFLHIPPLSLTLLPIPSLSLTLLPIPSLSFTFLIPHSSLQWTGSQEGRQKCQTHGRLLVMQCATSTGGHSSQVTIAQYLLLRSLLKPHMPVSELLMPIHLIISSEDCVHSSIHYT